MQLQQLQQAQLQQAQLQQAQLQQAQLLQQTQLMQQAAALGVGDLARGLDSLTNANPPLPDTFAAAVARAAPPPAPAQRTPPPVAPRPAVAAEQPPFPLIISDAWVYTSSRAGALMRQQLDQHPDHVRHDLVVPKAKIARIIGMRGRVLKQLQERARTAPPSHRRPPTGPPARHPCCARTATRSKPRIRTVVPKPSSSHLTRRARTAPDTSREPCPTRRTRPAPIPPSSNPAGVAHTASASLPTPPLHPSPSTRHGHPLPSPPP